MFAAKRRVERAQDRGLAGDEETTTGIAVEPVDEFERLPGSGRAQGFDHPEAHPAPAVYGDSRRLVEDDERFILVDDTLIDALDERVRSAPGMLSGVDPDRRDAYDVARLEALLGLGPAGIDADLTLADQPVQAALRNLLQVPAEPGVESLPCPVAPDLDLPRGRAGFGPIFGWL